MAPSWVSDVLDLAACIGKIFDLALCIKLVGTDDSSDTRIQIQECELLEIVRPSAVYSNCSEFEHDLLRRTICQSMGTHRQRRLANLLFEHYQETSPDNTRLLATLAYQAGRATECIEQSEAYTDYCEKQNNNAEALFGLFLKLIIVDSESEWHKRMLDFVYVDWDDAVATATPPEKEPLSQISKYEDTLSVMIRLLEKLSVVGSTTAEVTRALLSSAEMLSSKLSKTVALAKLKVIEGRYCFDENDFFAALASFQEAVSLCSQNDTAEAKEVKGLGMMFQGIIRRYIGETDEAYVDFLEAFKSRKRADWFLYRQLLANLGALYLPVDLRKTREYWQRGLSAMRCAKSSVAKQSYVHFVTNIAHLDILEDRLESAENLLLESRGSARKLGLRQELIRNHIQFGCLEMSRGRLHLAAEYFLEAEGLAVSTNHYRKLWRIRANLATIAELQGDIKQSYVYDLSVTKTSPPITLAQSLVDIDTDRMWRRTRATCAYANIALRSTTSTLHDKIIESLSSSVRTIAKNVAAAATSRTTECPGLLFFLKLFSVPRFIITD
jgi:Flp pilus assembly protein TadD